MAESYNPASVKLGQTMDSAVDSAMDYADMLALSRLIGLLIFRNVRRFCSTFACELE